MCRAKTLVIGIKNGKILEKVVKSEVFRCLCVPTTPTLGFSWLFKVYYAKELRQTDRQTFANLVIDLVTAATSRRQGNVL